METIVLYCVYNVKGFCLNIFCDFLQERFWFVGDKLGYFEWSRTSFVRINGSFIPIFSFICDVSMWPAHVRVFLWYAPRDFFSVETCIKHTSKLWEWIRVYICCNLVYSAFSTVGSYYILISRIGPTISFITFFFI